MAEYNPSKIIKDGNTYNFRDTTKIPLAGSNQISGSLIPSTDGTVNLGSNSYRFRECYFGNVYATGLFGNPNTGFDINYTIGANLILRGKDRPNEAGIFGLVADNGSSSSRLLGAPDGTLSWSGDKFILGYSEPSIVRNTDNDAISIHGGTAYKCGATLYLTGKDSANSGNFQLIAHDGVNTSSLIGIPNGTLTWNGQSIQTTSDQRLKQQITEIDDDLLTAWEDVNLVQFKYNDAVKEKSDNARLHTGYVVQQIDEACKSHGVDISEYGLYCHEEYAEETREVEHDDGTKTTEVVRPANEHYSLRYTEALIVECAYLRKCIKELRNEIEQLKSSK